MAKIEGNLKKKISSEMKVALRFKLFALFTLFKLLALFTLFMLLRGEGGGSGNVQGVPKKRTNKTN